MRCPNCQAPITESDLFCGECGRPASLDVLSPSSSQKAAEPPPMPGPPLAQPPPAPQPQPKPTAPPPSYAPTPAAPPPPAQASYAPPPPPAHAEPLKKKSNTGCIIAVVVVLVLACCGILGFSFASGLAEDLFSDPFGPSTPDYFDTPTVVPPTTGGGDTEIWVQNNLDEAICYLYISSPNNNDWGEDWLANYGSIPAGTYATFAITSGQTVDMMVEDCFGNQLDVQYDVYIYPEGITYTLDPLQ